MKQLPFIVLVSVFISAAPCAAQPAAAPVNDAAGARSALSSAAAKDRLQAINYLAMERDFETLAGHFASEKDAYLRVQIVEALDVAGSTWAYACAGLAAADGNQAVRQAAAGAIAQRTGAAEANKQLSALAADPSENVRAAVVNAMLQHPGPAAASIVGGVLSDKAATPMLRREAAASLARMKNKEADAELLKHAADPDKEIRASVSSRTPAKPKTAKTKKKPAAKR